MKPFILSTIVILCCLYSQLYGQNIVCNSIYFDLIPISEADTAIVDFKYKLNIKLNLSISDLKKDTISLKTGIKIGQELGPNNLKAWAIKKNDSIPLESWVENHAGPQLFEDSQLLKFIVPHRENIKLSVSYNVLGTGFFFYIQQLNDIHMFAYHADYENFYPMNIPISKVGGVNATDNIQPFYSHRINGSGKESIDLTFIDKSAFEEEYFESSNMGVRIYTPDSLAAKESLINVKKKLVTHLSALSPYMKKRKEASLILLNWRDDKNRQAFGRAFGNHCICDYSFSSNSMLHEMIHIALPSQVPDGSDGEYFIKECIIEWLALFLSNRLNKIDASMEVDGQNLFNTHINDANTWNLIYSYGPYILQRIAQNISEEKLADIIVNFLQDKEDGMTEYREFLFYLNDYISPDLIEYMDKMVRGLNP